LTLGTLLLAASVLALTRPGLIIQRELYHGLEAVGVISRDNGLWGQILGRNIPSHHPLIRAGVLDTAAFLTVLPGALALVALRRRPPGAIRRIWTAPRMRVLILAGAFAISTGLTMNPVLGWGRSAALEIGKDAGCDYFQSGGALGVGPDGPFLGGDWADVCNLLWHWLGPVSLALLGAAIASITDTTLMGTLARPMPGRCLNCGYELGTDTASPCPECGKPTEQPHPPGPADASSTG